MANILEIVNQVGVEASQYLAAWLSNKANWPGIATTAASGGFAYVSALIQRGARKEQQRAEERMRALQEEQIRSTLDQQVLRWGGDTITLLTEVEKLARQRTRPDFQDRREGLRSALSATVDQGRLFFPNVSHDIVGLDRPFANRGYRPPILDAIMLDYERLARLDPAADADAMKVDEQELFAARRAFVSELQRALDPRRRDALLRNLESSKRAQDLADAVVWDSVKPLVERYEAQYGPGAFWADPPKPRHLLEGAQPKPKPVHPFVAFLQRILPQRAAAGVVE